MQWASFGLAHLRPMSLSFGKNPTNFQCNSKNGLTQKVFQFLKLITRTANKIKKPIFNGRSFSFWLFPISSWNRQPPLGTLHLFNKKEGMINAIFWFPLGLLWTKSLLELEKYLFIEQTGVTEKILVWSSCFIRKTQQAFTCSKLTIQTVEQGVKHFQS